MSNCLRPLVPSYDQLLRLSSRDPHFLNAHFDPDFSRADNSRRVWKPFLQQTGSNGSGWMCSLAEGSGSFLCWPKRGRALIIRHAITLDSEMQYPKALEHIPGYRQAMKKLDP